MGNRITENAKRSDAAFGRAFSCRACYMAMMKNAQGDDRPAVAYCDEHRCSGVTRKGTRCKNAATVPETGTCLIHVRADSNTSRGKR